MFWFPSFSSLNLVCSHQSTDLNAYMIFRSCPCLCTVFCMDGGAVCCCERDRSEQMYKNPIHNDHCWVRLCCSRYTNFLNFTPNAWLYNDHCITSTTWDPSSSRAAVFCLSRSLLPVSLPFCWTCRNASRLHTLSFFFSESLEKQLDLISRLCSFLILCIINNEWAAKCLSPFTFSIHLNFSHQSLLKVSIVN